MNILPCDSILGTCFYTLSCITIPLMIFFFFWIIFRFVELANRSLVSSRWYESVNNVCMKYLLEQESYRNDFSFLDRSSLALRLEIRNQYKYIQDIFYWMLYAIITLVFRLIQLTLIPIGIAIAPVIYFGKRVLLLCCNIQTDVVHAGRKSPMSVDVLIERAVNGTIDLLKRLQLFCRLQKRKFLKLLSRSTYVSGLRVVGYKFLRFITCAKPVAAKSGVLSRRAVVEPEKTEQKSGGLRMANGEWREELKITSRERCLRRLLTKVNGELDDAKIEFVSDHVLTITVFDTVMDTGGLLMLVCSYRWTRMWFSLILPFELLVYAALAAVSNYYFIWQTRAIILVGVNVIGIVYTYLIQPYAAVADRWVDWVGRWMIAFVCLGIVLYDNTAPPEQKVKGTSGNGGLSMLISTTSDVFTTLKENPASAGKFLLLDVLMVLFMYLYAMSILENIGVFRVASRYFRKVRYAMHDYIVDFIVRKVDDRALGVENMHVSLPLIQQWDDVIRDQRRYGLIPTPDVRPPNLLTFREKMIEVKWASLFNLTVSNMRTSLGLSFLHIVMCSADPEITRWIIHQHPHLLSEQDFQRDTPISIALKECAYYLMMYSNMNDGVMDDGTSFADDEFYAAFPEILEIRENVSYNGEFVSDLVVSYELSADERDFMDENYYLIERTEEKKDWKPGMVRRLSDASLQSMSLTSKPGPAAKSKIKRRNSMGSLGAQAVHVKRYPEDNFYDDFEGGQAAGWVLLGIDVPENVIDNEQYGSDSDFESNEDDLRYGIRESAEMTDLDSVTLVPKNHPSLKGSLTKNGTDFLTGFDLILRKKEVVGMSRRNSVSSASEIANDPNGLPDEEFEDVENKQDAREAVQKKTQEILWRLCKYADIFLSDQIFVHCFNMGWDTVAYKELNKMASQLQGLLSQHLAVCFNLNPPPGFVRFSDWSVGSTENIQEEYGEFDAMDDDEKRSKQKMFKGKIGNTLINSVSVMSKGLQSVQRLLSRKKKDALDGNAFNDRIVQYLAECYASSRDEADLSDSELGVPARIAWRAISRAFRKKSCTFIIPGIFTPPKPIMLQKLHLQRNELDCGDAVMLADVIINQQTLLYVDCSFNRIGSRGMNRLCQAMKGHRSIRTFRADYNRIGPASGKFLGSWIRQTQTIQTISLSHNRLGALVRWPSTSSKETMPGAGRYIFLGLKGNKTIQSLDVSYNDLGPEIGDLIPIAVKMHLNIFSLNIAGNSLGHRGPAMLWSLAGRAGGANSKKANKRGSQASGSMYGGSSVFGASKKGKSKSKSRSIGPLGESISDAGTLRTGLTSKRPVRRTRLAELVLADNQLGEEAGLALGHYLKSSGTLTSLDVSGNSLGVVGGKHVAQFLCDAYGHNARIIEKKMDEEGKILKHKRRERAREEYRRKRLEDGYNKLDDGLSDFDGSETTVSEDEDFPDHWKKKISLLHLDVSRNGLGPINVQVMMDAIAMPNCTITSLDISDNPLGVSSERAGKSVMCASAIRKGIMKNCTLKRIKLNNLFLTPPQVLPLLGGISNSRSLIEIQVNDMLFDEPCCLQLANGIGACLTLQKIVVRNCVMGPKGGGLVAVNIERVAHNLRHLDMTSNRIGFCAMEPIFRALSKDSCGITTLLVADNELDEEGGLRIVQALKANPVITELDISRNFLTGLVARELAEVTKEYIIGGEIITNCKIRKILLNDNPDIGNRGARALVNAFSNEWTEHVEMRNIGASQNAAHEVSLSLRKVTVAWKHLDLSHNNFSRVGLNQVFWSLRQNRRLRVLRLGHNKGGLQLGASNDTLGRYGVGLLRALQENLVVRELDLSYLGLSSEAGTNIFTALQNNFTIRVLKVRGNCFDDNCSISFENLLKENDVITELDIGANKFGSNFAYALADGLVENRSIQTLISDNNNLAVAGASTLQSFYNAILYNHSLRRMNLDGNRMGTVWGLRIAEGLSKNSTILQISLRNNRLDSRVGEALLKMYSHNTTLQELAVSSEEVGMDVFARIRSMFLRKRQVAHEDLVELQTTMEVNQDNVFGKLYG